MAGSLSQLIKIQIKKIEEEAAKEDSLVKTEGNNDWLDLQSNDFAQKFQLSSKKFSESISRYVSVSPSSYEILW